VLEDAQGPCWGNVQFLRGDPPREAALPIEPGKYQVEAVLRTENQAGVLMSGTDLWAGTSTVKVQADKDAVIEIPWK